MKEEIDNFLNYLAQEKKFSPHTIAAYRNDLNQFVAESVKMGVDSSPSSLSNQLLLEYRHQLWERKYKSTTLARKIATLRSFIKFLAESGKLVAEVGGGLKSPKVDKTSPKFLSVPEVRRLLAEPTKLSSPEAKRDRAMLELLYATGLRASELMSLDVTDVNFETDIIYCSGRRSGNRDITIDKAVLRIIKDYLETARSVLIKGEEPALFVNRRGERLTRQGFWQIVKEYGNKAGFGDKVTPNILRHSFAIHQLKGGADLPSVQKKLGHAYPVTTRVYEQIRETIVTR